MVLTLVIISSLYNLGVSAFVFLLPVYAKEFLQVGPVQLGWLWSALGVGMLCASTWLAWKKHSDVHGQMRIIVMGMTIGGLAVCSLSLMKVPLIAAALVVVVGGQYGCAQSHRLGASARSDAGTFDRTRPDDV